MRDEFKLPIIYRWIAARILLRPGCLGLSGFQTTAEELTGLFLARSTLESVRGTALANTLRSAFSKLTRGMLGKIQFAWSDLGEAFSRKVVEQSSRNIKRFREIV